MPKIRLREAKTPSWLGGPEAATDLVNPLGIARRALFKTVGKGFSLSQKKSLAKELRAIPQRVLDSIVEVIKGDSPLVRAAIEPYSGIIEYSKLVPYRAHPGVTSHEIGHLLWTKLKPKTKGILRIEDKGLLGSTKDILQENVRTYLPNAEEIFAEAYAQQTLRKAKMRSRENLFPPYTRRLTRRLKKIGR